MSILLPLIIACLFYLCCIYVALVDLLPSSLGIAKSMILNVQIVDKLHWYAQNGDMVRIIVLCLF